MAKPKSAHSYELEIIKMIRSRNGEFDEWLRPQLEATAMNRVILSKIQAEVEKEQTLLLCVKGSNGQPKYDAHPLLAAYDKLQRTLILQYGALGLNFNTTPSKVTEPTNKAVKEHDPLMTLLGTINANLDNAEGVL